MPKSIPEAQVISGPSSPTAGAGRGFVNPRPVNVPEEEFVSASDRFEMEKQRKEDREMRAAEKAYNDSMTSKKKGGSVSSASKRADGCAQRGKTKGTYV